MNWRERRERYRRAIYPPTTGFERLMLAIAAAAGIASAVYLAWSLLTL